MSSDGFRYWLEDRRNNSGLLQSAFYELFALAVRVFTLGAITTLPVYIGVYLMFDFEWYWIPLDPIFWGVMVPLVSFATLGTRDFTRPPEMED